MAGIQLRAITLFLFGSLNVVLLWLRGPFCAFVPSPLAQPKMVRGALRPRNWGQQPRAVRTSDWEPLDEVGLKAASSGPPRSRKDSSVWGRAGAIAVLAASCCVGFAVALLAVPHQAAAATAAGATVAAGAAAAVGAPDLGAVLSKAAASATKGGVAGLVAGVAQVLSFMWLRTSMNYQYFNGGTLQSALTTLWREGGIRRLYQGVSLAIIQAPLSRFGDTAANAGMLVLAEVYFPDAPIAIKTGAASTAAALWRVFLTPIDTLKTARQVQGDGAVDMIWQRVKKRGPGELYAGAFANFAANWAGNYPYFVVFNSLSEAWAAPLDPTGRIVRNGLLGMCSSIASDTVSNSLRVLKTMRQSDPDGELDYFKAAQRVIEKEGPLGLLGRGLETRILTNVLQGSFFAIVWKIVEERLT